VSTTLDAADVDVDIDELLSVDAEADVAELALSV
jgi:hypothetical protein